MGELTSQGEPSVEEILAEVERRRTEARQEKEKQTAWIVVLVDRIVFWLTKHWLAVLNLLAFLYVGLPFLAPVLLATGLRGPGKLIHGIYRLHCHQLPQRSWFLFGLQPAYTLEELMTLVGQAVMPEPMSGVFVGNDVVGYKVAFCQRDVAIYGFICLAGLLFGLLRRRGKVQPLKWWLYISLGILPMLIDGGYQFLSYGVSIVLPRLPITPHETTPLLRTVTGALFGWATVWLAYPYVQETMDEFRESLHKRFGWE